MAEEEQIQEQIEEQQEQLKQIQKEYEMEKELCCQMADNQIQNQHPQQLLFGVWLLPRQALRKHLLQVEFLII